MDLSRRPLADADFPATWPGATQPESLIKPRPQPPRAPRRGPAAAEWAVPPLLLPAAPRKLADERPSAASSTHDGSGQETGGSDEEGSEVCVFSLGGAAGEDGDEEGPTEDPELFSLGAWSPEPTDHADPLPTGVAGKGEGGAAPAWTLGASPVLLSAIESVAAAQGLRRQLSV